MTATEKFIDKRSPYPGEYRPAFHNWNEIMMEVKRPHEGSCKPSANISECSEYFKIEIIAPGHSRSDFMVSLNENILSVIAIKPKQENEQRSYRLHEFNFEYFSHELKLPENIDADFVRAEYKDGILSISFPKTSEPTSNMVHQIIVY